MYCNNSSINELWNIKNLEPPPIASYKTKTHNVDISKLQSIFSEAIKAFQNQKQFEREAAFLSRYIYCMKTKLRHNKVLKVIGKINQALLRYLRINFVYRLEMFYEMIPKANGANIYLPTCSLLQYILVRLQGIAKLMVRVVETSQIAALLLEQLINVAHLWKTYFIGFGIVSRIYVLTKEICKFCCQLYAQLLPFTETLPGTSWLPLNYPLPNDLKLWLGANCLTDDDLRKDVPCSASDYLSIFKLEDLGSDEEWVSEFINEDSTAKYKSNKSITHENLIRNRQSSHKSNLQEDIGIPVEQNICLLNLKKKKLKHVQKSDTNSHLVDSIQTISDLKKFERDFKKHPNKYSKNFKKLDKLQCNMLYKTIAKCIKKSEKYINDVSKVNACLCEAKNALRCL